MWVFFYVLVLGNEKSFGFWYFYVFFSRKSVGNLFDIVGVGMVSSYSLGDVSWDKKSLDNIPNFKSWIFREFWTNISIASFLLLEKVLLRGLLL